MQTIERIEKMVADSNVITEYFRSMGDYKTVVRRQVMLFKRIKVRLLLDLGHEDLRKLMVLKDISATYRRVWEPSRGRRKRLMAAHIARWAKW
jgi:hypothetical protein